MASGPKLVHKQFNSPMGLYSQNNIQETLNKHMSTLNNGALGIDFRNDPTASKPANLANSSVLRMLEEEERQRRGLPKLDQSQIDAIVANLQHVSRRYDWPPGRMARAKSWDGQLNLNSEFYSEFLSTVAPGQKKVVWPPAPETNGYHQDRPDSAAAQQAAPVYYNHAPVQSATKPAYHAAFQSPTHQPPQQQQQGHQAPQQTYQPQQGYQQPEQGYQQHGSPYSAACEGKRQEQAAINRLIPVDSGVSVRPAPRVNTYAPTSPQPYQGYKPAPTFTPQTAPAYSPQPYQTSPFSPPAAQFSPQPAPFSPQPVSSPQAASGRWAPVGPPQSSPLSPQSYGGYSAPAPPQHFEPPPSTITLRQHQPVHQRPPPVFASQPATTSFQGGVNMRGDQKWPPQNVKEAVEAENEARRTLAKGPACRPRKVQKDYSRFFAQHALNNTYPGYKAPPGTQHFNDHTGQTSF